MTCLKSIGQSLFVDKTATCTVDDAHALLGLGEIFAAQDVFRLLGEGHMQRDEIGAREKLVKLDFLDLHLLGLLC